MDLISGRAHHEWIAEAVAFGIGWPLLIGMLYMRARARASRAPAELEPLVEEALEEAGIHGATLTYWDRGDQASRPRPFAFAKQIAISRAVAEGLTPNALRWTIKTDALAGWLGCVRAFPLLGGGLLVAIAAASLEERWKLPGVYVLGPLGFVALVFAATGFYGWRLQLLADQKFTKTGDDRAAAKEALSFAFFSQEDRPSGNRGLFSRRELSGRARRLGIVLARGYRVGAEGKDRESQGSSATLG